MVLGVWIHVLDIATDGIRDNTYSWTLFPKYKMIMSRNFTLYKHKEHFLKIVVNKISSCQSPDIDMKCITSDLFLSFKNILTLMIPILYYLSYILHISTFMYPFLYQLWEIHLGCLFVVLLSRSLKPGPYTW
jgi:hypothetical protein